MQALAGASAFGHTCPAARPSEAVAAAAGQSGQAAVPAHGPSSARLLAPSQRRLTSLAMGSKASRGVAVASSTVDGAEVSTASRTVEFMVDMTCQGCVNLVDKALGPVEGVESFDIDLESKSVKVVGTAAVDDIIEVIQATSKKGRKVRLIGQGNTKVFGEELAQRLGMDQLTLTESLAAVAEFKGDYTNHGQTLGVIRFAQVTEDVATVEASFDGLAPGEHAVGIHLYGDLSRGLAGVGGLFEGEGDGLKGAGLVATVVADETGHAQLPLRKLPDCIKVWGIIGRALVIHDGPEVGTEGQASVIARAAAVGMNYKQLCTCDGVVIWDSNFQR
mmetsp:Transcript_49993/g.159997  ORF Transcript_49993/g.159997 Transcript_49993/m.159997 type:complete len:333 (+) Transcript_49993:56-1054(+)